MGQRMRSAHPFGGISVISPGGAKGEKFGQSQVENFKTDADTRAFLVSYYVRERWFAHRSYILV